MEFIAHNLAPIMFAGLICFLLVGFPVAFTLMGQHYWGLNGGPHYRLTPAASITAVAPAPRLSAMSL